MKSYIMRTLFKYIPYIYCALGITSVLIFTLYEAKITGNPFDWEYFIVEISKVIAFTFVLLIGAYFTANF